MMSVMMYAPLSDSSLLVTHGSKVVPPIGSEANSNGIAELGVKFSAETRP